MTFAYTSLVTILAVFITFYFQLRVGLARGKYKVLAPKVTGNETWESMFRVHVNTVEQLAIFLPSLWLCALTGGDKLAAGIGVIWLVGRLLYSRLYLKNPLGRAPGMALTILPTLAMALIALYHTIIAIWF